MNNTRKASFLLWLIALSMPYLIAQSPGPQPAPMAAQIPEPRDVPYPGIIALNVDATDIVRHIFSVREIIPVRGGESLTLLYPQWQPGNHAPSGRVDKLAGLVISGGGARLDWTRDPADVFAFHLSVPPGVNSLEVRFQYASPVEPGQGRMVMTPELLNVQWINLALYPAGYFVRQIPVAASVILPEGWQFATALEIESAGRAAIRFQPVSFETLADSPLFAGRYFQRFDLDPGAKAPVHLDVFADRPGQLAATPEQIEAHRALVRQAYRLFGSRHYEHYDLLLALSDHLGGIGLEHQQSSENATAPDYFTGWNRIPDTRNLLPHEFTHSWNGKFRRPADLWTPSFNVPMRDSLLWVYEGQTQYWGYVLEARSGLITKQQALDAFAATAAAYDHRQGRQWRTLEDTTNDPIAAMRRPLPWLSWQRSEDYYSEGQLLWLDADTLIREKSGGRKSLDDFARAFFGINDGSLVTVTYTFEDVVQALNDVWPYDWAAFLKTRLQGHGPGAPLDGIKRGGYKLIYSDTPTLYFAQAEARRQISDLSYSLGMVVGSDGRISDVLWDGPAFQQGITVGTQIIAVNGTAYRPERLTDAIREAKDSSAPIELLLKDGDRYRTARLDYHQGLRYPRLERDPGVPARLDDILTPKN